MCEKLMATKRKCGSAAIREGKKNKETGKSEGCGTCLRSGTVIGKICDNLSGVVEDQARP